MIGILDYGMANLRSVQKAFAHVGSDAQILKTPDDIRSCDHLVLPGVGALADAVTTIRDRGLDQPILEHIRSGKPFLGICLGLQMLFEVGYEDGEHRALGVFAGKCVRFEVDQTHGLKVPHMGWNQLNVVRLSPLMRDIPEGASVYFVHSYHVVPEEESVVATTTEYGKAFVSSIWRDNVIATQFHPEKSQSVGLMMLKNFARM